MDVQAVLVGQCLGSTQGLIPRIPSAWRTQFRGFPPFSAEEVQRLMVVNGLGGACIHVCPACSSVSDD